MLGVEPEGKYVGRELEIALDHGIIVYDALYFALAEERSLPLLTLDAKQG